MERLPFRPHFLKNQKRIWGLLMHAAPALHSQNTSFRHPPLRACQYNRIETIHFSQYLILFKLKYMVFKTDHECKILGMQIFIPLDLTYHARFRLFTYHLPITSLLFEYSVRSFHDK